LIPKHPTVTTFVREVWAGHDTGGGPLGGPDRLWAAVHHEPRPGNPGTPPKVFSEWFPDPDLVERFRRDGPYNPDDHRHAAASAASVRRIDSLGGGRHVVESPDRVSGTIRTNGRPPVGLHRQRSS